MHIYTIKMQKLNLKLFFHGDERLYRTSQNWRFQRAGYRKNYQRPRHAMPHTERI